jgi:hypothetical protein
MAVSLDSWVTLTTGRCSRVPDGSVLRLLPPNLPLSLVSRNAPPELVPTQRAWRPTLLRLALQRQGRSSRVAYDLCSP